MKNYIKFCSLSSTFPGSFVKCIDKMVDTVNQRGDNLVLVFPKEAQEQKWCIDLAEKTKVCFIDSQRAVLNIKTYKQISQILKERSYDVIHSHYESFDINLYLIKKFLKIKSKLVWHLHCCPLAMLNDLSLIRKLYNIIKYKYFTKDVYLITINDENKNLLSKYAKKAKKIVTIINGIDFYDLKITNAISDNITFITFGWDFYRKGDDLLIDASCKLWEKGYQFKTLINGNNNTFLEIKNYIKSDIPEGFILQPPVFDRNEFFSKGEVFIQASRQETFSYGVCEASFLGKYVICSDDDGMKWANYLPNVHIFKKGSVDELVEQMEYYLKNKQNIEFDENYVRNEIEKNYSDSVWVTNILNFYEKTI